MLNIGTEAQNAILGGAKKRDSKKNQMKQFSLSRFEIPSKNITVF
jgi:hypothetical protein